MDRETGKPNSSRQSRLLTAQTFYSTLDSIPELCSTPSTDRSSPDFPPFIPFLSSSRLFNNRPGATSPILHGVTKYDTPRKDNNPREKSVSNPSTVQSDVHCPGCKKPTKLGSEGRIKFNNKLYHKHCFVCSNCRKFLGNIQKARFTLTNDGRPQCGECDIALAKICYQCSKPIYKSGTITFDTKNYHIDCFRCGQCNKLLKDEEGLFQHNGKPYCESCNKELFSPRCCKCSQAINGKYSILKGQNYHHDCITCVECRRVIAAQEPIYETELGLVCKKCNRLSKFF